jgi:hypothetical protein
MKTRLSWFALCLFLLTVAVGFQALPQAQDTTDPVVKKIIELGTTDNQVMTWSDYISNRFGGRETGTGSYTDATEWAVWQFKQLGLEAHLEEAGEVPVGFDRGPWFGKMLKPTEKALRFGTPSYTAGTKGSQRGPVVVLKADPFSVPGRAQNGQPVSKENVEKKRAAVQSALAEIKANKAAFKGAWVMIPGTSSGFARDGRRGTRLPDGSPEYLDADMMPPLTKALIDAGALGTIQAAVPPAPIQAEANSEPPLNLLDGFVASWDKLPVLPDIKLLDSQYKEILALVEKKEPVVLEFDIRNWFKMGPVKYHNVVVTLRGSTYPDEYVVIGGHFDGFSSAAGAVDDGNGYTAGMEAIRLIKAAGAKPKRSVVFIGFAAEEQGLVGSQAWLKRHPELHGKIVLMINRDGGPSAVTGASVPEAWYEDFKTITAPLATLNPKWPFTLTKGIPRARSTRPGGTDSSSFEMAGVATLNFASTTFRPGPDGKDLGFNYGYIWHTTNDLYNVIDLFKEHQQHSALATAVVAYGVANLDKPLTREGVFLADGLYAAFAIGAGDSPRQLMVNLDYANAPLATANFIRIIEGNAPPAGPGRGGMGFGPPGAPQPPPIGKFVVGKAGLVSAIIASDTQKSVAILKLPKTRNRALTHGGAGVLGITGPNTFYLTLKKNPGLDGKYPAIGKVIAGLDALTEIKPADPIRYVRIVRVGQAATDFKTDDQAFKVLMDSATKKK